MTTTIKVHAHCGDDKEVKIISTGIDDVIIQDGEKHSLSVYDDIVCTVQEVEKVVAEAQIGPCTDPLDEDC